MGTLVGIIVFLGACLAVLFRNFQTAKTNEKLATVKAQDSALTASQNEIKAAIASLDEGIAKAKDQKVVDDRKAAEDNMSLKERADRLRNGIQ